MLGEMELERLYLRPIDFYETNNITLRLGTKVDAITQQKNQSRFRGNACLRQPDPQQLDHGHAGCPQIGVIWQGGSMRDLAYADAMAEEFKRAGVPDYWGWLYRGRSRRREKGVNVTLVEMADRIYNALPPPKPRIVFARHIRRRASIFAKALAWIT